MAQIIQIKRTSADINNANPVGDLEKSAGVDADNLATGELFYADSVVTGTGTGVLYVGKNASAGTASIIGGEAFTSMLDIHQLDTKTKLTQTTTANASGGAGLTLADESSTGSITISAPTSVSGAKEVFLPAEGGLVTASSLLSTNIDNNITQALVSTKQVTAVGLDATDGNITNSGAISGATSLKNETSLAVLLADEVTTAGVTHASLVGTDGLDQEGNPPTGGLTTQIMNQAAIDTATANEETPPAAVYGVGWQFGNNYVFTALSTLNIDLGYNGKLDAGAIAINATAGHISGATIEGGTVAATDAVTAGSMSVAAGAFTVDPVTGNVTTQGDITSETSETYVNASAETVNAANLVITNGSVNNAFNVNAQNQISVTAQTGVITDGTASLQAGALSNLTGVNVASGNVTAPVVQSTAGAASLDSAGKVSGATFAFTGGGSIRGDLEVSGNMLTTNTSEVTIADSMIHVASDGYGQTVTNDLGWYGNASRLLVAPVSGPVDDGAGNSPGDPEYTPTTGVISANDASGTGSDGIAGTGYIGSDRGPLTVTLVEDLVEFTNKFTHNSVIGSGVVDGGDNSPPIAYDAEAAAGTTGWQYGDSFVISNDLATANPQNNIGTWEANDKYLTFVGMAFDQNDLKFKVLQNDDEPTTHWAVDSTIASLEANIDGDITGNAATVTTNADLTGMVTSNGNVTTVVTNADLTGDVTSSGNATAIGGGKVIGTMLNADVAQEIDQTSAQTIKDTGAASSINLITDGDSKELKVNWTADGVDSGTYDSLNTAAVKSLIGTEATSTIAGADDSDVEAKASIANNEVLSFDEFILTTANDAAAGAVFNVAGLLGTTRQAGDTGDGSVYLVNDRVNALSKWKNETLADADIQSVLSPAASTAADAGTVGTMSIADHWKLTNIADNAIANITAESLTDLLDVPSPVGNDITDDKKRLTFNIGINSGTAETPIYAGSSFSWEEDSDDELQAGAVKRSMIDFGQNVTDVKVNSGDIPEGAHKIILDDAALAGTPEKDLIGTTADDYLNNSSAAGSGNAWVSGENFFIEGTEATSNLYYKDERVDDRVSSLIQPSTNTIDVTENGATTTTKAISWGYDDGTNTLTPTVSLLPFTTADLTEHSTNEYYTDTKVATKVNSMSSYIRGAGAPVAYNVAQNVGETIVNPQGISTEGILLGENGIIGDVNTDISVFTDDNTDSVIVKFGPDDETDPDPLNHTFAKTITLSNDGIAGVGANLKLSGFIADGGTLTAPAPE